MPPRLVRHTAIELVAHIGRCIALVSRVRKQDAENFRRGRLFCRFPLCRDSVTGCPCSLAARGTNRLIGCFTAASLAKCGLLSTCSTFVMRGLGAFSCRHLQTMYPSLGNRFKCRKKSIRSTRHRKKQVARDCSSKTNARNKRRVPEKTTRTDRRSTNRRRRKPHIEADRYRIKSAEPRPIALPPNLAVRFRSI